MRVGVPLLTALTIGSRATVDGRDFLWTCELWRGCWSEFGRPRPAVVWVGRPAESADWVTLSGASLGPSLWLTSERVALQSAGLEWPFTARSVPCAVWCRRRSSATR